ncbi:hypothetical protein KL918_003604 [Ogataea parapolymorpha]|nr:hypothetical protein KL918_003604 [Ogataea parapolymorpha]KAG7870607.1 hypothetical protein KL916_004812 [Ogataea parapolymorpha]
MIQISTSSPSSAFGTRLTSTKSLILMLLKLSTHTVETGSHMDAFTNKKNERITLASKVMEHLPLSIQLLFSMLQGPYKESVIYSIKKSLENISEIRFVDHQDTEDSEIDLRSDAFKIFRQFLLDDRRYESFRFEEVYISEYDDIVKLSCWKRLKIDLSRIKQFSHVWNKVSTLVIDSDTKMDVIESYDLSCILQLEIVGPSISFTYIQRILEFCTSIRRLVYKDLVLDEASKGDVVLCPNNGETEFNLLLNSSTNIEFLNEIGMRNVKNFNLTMTDKNSRIFDMNQHLACLASVQTITVNSLLNLSYLPITFDSVSSKVQYLNFSHCELENCDFSPLSRLKELVLLDCIIDSKQLNTLRNLSQISSLILINCKINWNHFWELPPNLVSIVLHNNDYEACKDLIFLSQSQKSNNEVKCYRRTFSIDVNSVKFQINCPLDSILSMAKFDTVNMKMPQVDSAEIELVSIPNFNGFDFSLFDFGDVEVSNMVIKLYSFGNVFHKPRNVPATLRCEYKYYNFNLIDFTGLKRSMDSKSELEFADINEISDYDSDGQRIDNRFYDSSDYSNSESEENSDQKKSRQTRSRRLRTTRIYKKTPSEEEVTEDSEEEEKRRSKLINTVISSKNIKPSINPKDANKPFECEFCSRAFKRKEHLRRHSLTHTNYRPHVCSNCRRGFRRSDNLKNHEKRCLASGKAGGTGYKLRNDPNRLDAEEIERVKSIEMAKKEKLKKLKEMGKSIKLAEFYESDRYQSPVSQRRSDSLSSVSDDMDHESDDYAERHDIDHDAFGGGLYHPKSKVSKPGRRSLLDGALETPPATANEPALQPGDITTTESNHSVRQMLNLKRSYSSIQISNAAMLNSLAGRDITSDDPNEQMEPKTGDSETKSLGDDLADEDANDDFIYTHSKFDTSDPVRLSIKQQVSQEFARCELMPNNTYKCSKCFQLFTKRGNLRRHLVIHFNLRPYVCECGKSFKRSDNYKKHASRCKTILCKRQKVGESNETVMKSETIRFTETIETTEAKSTHDLGSLTSLANSSNADIGEIKPGKVETVHHNDNSEESDTDTHVSTKADERKFECSFCQKKFKRKYHLNRHLIVHQNDNMRPFSCLRCGTAFKRNDLLEKHILYNKCRQAAT